MTESEIGRIWSKHFPKSSNGHVSEQICRMICLIFEKKLLLEPAGEDYQATVTRVLARCNIPAREFAACRNHIKPVLHTPI